MTQVWMIRNSDTDIHLFNRQEHLRPSIEISFSRCPDVKIEEKWSYGNIGGDVTFTITGKRGVDGSTFTETVEARRYPVWTEPSHL